MGGKGGSSSPPPIDPGKSMGEYLFGKDFGSAQGITDPRLQDRLISAEQTYRPQYTALELADINVMAQGIEEGSANPEYARISAELAGLRAGQESGAASRTRESIEASALELYPDDPKVGIDRGKNRLRFNAEQASKRNAFIKAAGDPGRDSATRIAELETRLAETPETLGQTKGLFQLLEDQSRQAGDLQREQLQLQRESDVGALREFAPQVVEAYRDADPYSTGLAEQQTAMAEDLYQRSQGLNPEQQRLVDQQALGMAQSQGRVTDQSAIAGQLMGREQYLSGLRGQASGMGLQAFNQNRLLAGDVGMTILGRPSQSIGLGGQMLGAATAGAAGQMGPQLFDPNVGLNMAMQQQSNEVSLSGANAQASAARSAGMMGAAGAIGGGIMASGGGAAAIAAI
jgi:hypothetical protein